MCPRGQKLTDALPTVHHRRCRAYGQQRSRLLFDASPNGVPRDVTIDAAALAGLRPAIVRLRRE
jgi:hypothetical protein